MADEITTASSTDNTGAQTAAENPAGGALLDPATQTETPAQTEGALLDPAAPAQAEEASPDPATETPAQAATDYSELKLPEGFTLDEARMAEATAAFTAGNVSPEQAQKLIDLHCKAVQEMAEAEQRRSVEAVTGWKAQIQGRPQYADEAPKVRNAVTRMAEKAPGIADVFRDPVLGNMPQLWELMVAVAEVFETEGNLLEGGGSAPAGGNAARFPGL